MQIRLNPARSTELSALPGGICCIRASLNVRKGILIMKNEGSKNMWYLTLISGVKKSGEAYAKSIDLQADSLVAASVLAGNLCEPGEEVMSISLMGDEDDFRVYSTTKRRGGAAKRFVEKSRLIRDEYNRTSGQFDLFDRMMIDD